MRIKPLLTRYLSPATVLGTFAALIGLIVIVGWHARLEAVLRISHDYPVMTYRTATGVALSGLALLLLGVGRPILARAVALVVTGASLLLTVEMLSSADVGLGRLLDDPYALSDRAASGGVAPQVAVGLIVTCLAIVLATARRPMPYRSFALATAGSLVVAVGGVARVDATGQTGCGPLQWLLRRDDIAFMLDEAFRRAAVPESRIRSFLRRG